MKKSKTKKADLYSLQKQFAAHIFNRNRVSIIGSFPYSNHEALVRLDIYRNNVFGNFSSVLSSIFGVTKKIVGDEKFAQLIEDYRQKYSSKNGNLDNYGNDFPRFLKKVKPAFLSDLARLELLFHLCYFASETKEFPLIEFKNLPPENFYDLRFELNPSCFLLASKYSIFSLWKSKDAKKLSLKKPEFVLIERARGNPEVRQLSTEEFIFLKSLAERKNLYETYQKVCRATKMECDIGKILSNFIGERVISGYFLEAEMVTVTTT